MTRKNASKTATSRSTKGKKTHPLVVSQSEIRAYVESLGIQKLRTVAARFQVVADLTSDAFELSKDQLAPSELQLIKRIAKEGDSEGYRRIMRAIISGIGQGRHGINAVHLAASAAVGMAFRWSYEYFSALNTYRDELRLRKRSLVDEPSARSTRRRSVLRVSNDR